VKKIVEKFMDPEVGCVAGEKRIYSGEKEKAVGAGEGIYWQYESLIKKLESDVNSTVGAAGELFAVRTELFENVETDTILDDFTISLRIAEKGYKVKYAPEANAYEKASFSIKEELKRKIRIASGGFQTLFRMSGLLNVFKHGLLSFQYISHKVLRWVLVPVSFLFIFFINLLIVLLSEPSFSFYSIILAIQVLFYLFVFTGWLLSNRRIRFKIIFMPYYLFVMNFSILAGMVRYFRKKHSPLWEKARRS
jgi:cellulose synthase/poly-beta-1,6-N-acetylglucosamine synthase-like glycosyltransferase